MDQETVKIIRSAQSGDTEAFHHLVALYDRQVMGLALKLVNDIFNAEDIYQEVFMKVFKNIKKFRFESDFSTWLYRITANTAFNFQKGMKKHSGKYSYENEDVDQWLPSHDSVSSDQQREMQTSIINAMNTLPQKQRTVFIMKHLEQLKIIDIAGILNCTEGTVKKYLFRAIEKLRVELKEYRYA